MPIPTEPIGSVPRTAELLAAMVAHGEGRIDADTLRAASEKAVAETVRDSGLAEKVLGI